MPKDNETRGRKSGLLIASTFLAFAGLALSTVGLIGGLGRAAAGDPEPIPEPESTPIQQTVIVPTEVPTEVPTRVVETTVPTTVPTSPPTSTSVPTSVPTSPPATSTSQPLTVATTAPTQVPTQVVQSVAGVTALPSTGEGSSARVSWLLVAAGAAIMLAGLAGIASGRRRT